MSHHSPVENYILMKSDKVIDSFPDLMANQGLWCSQAQTCFSILLHLAFYMYERVLKKNCLMHLIKRRNRQWQNVYSEPPICCFYVLDVVKTNKL